MNASPLRCALFDLDGTLADTAGDLALALNRVRAGRGLAAVDPLLLRPHASAGARGLLRAGMDIAPDHPEYEALRTAFLGHYEQCLATTSVLFDGVGELLSALEARGVRWGVVTNKATRYAVPVCRALGLLDRAAALVCGDTTPTPKPHPAPLTLAATTAGMAPQACVYVGDDLRDVQAGNAAGMATLIAGWGYLGGETPVTEWPATATLARPGEVLAFIAARDSATAT